MFERSDDGSGTLGEAFREAGAALGQIWCSLPANNPAALARDLLGLLDGDGYGATDRLLAAASPALGAEGRAEMRRLLSARLALPDTGGGEDATNPQRLRREALWRLRELADALAARYPAAATLLHRALAEDVLRRAASKHYPYAARDVLACSHLASALPDEGSLEGHQAFMIRLRCEHPRKAAFWSLLPSEC